MSKDKISDYSQTAPDNKDIAGIGIRGSDPVRNMDNALREIMSHLADMNKGDAPLHDTLTLADPDDETKQLRLDASNISTGETRVLSAPDADGTIWTSGNQGSLSGLDADLLDGQEGAFYQNASNLNAGTVSDARLPATISSDITGNAATATNAAQLNNHDEAYYRNASHLNAGVIPAARLPDVISASTQTALNGKLAKSGGLMTGALSAPQMISTAAKSDVVDGNMNGAFLKNTGNHFGFRQSENDDLCIDVNHGGSAINALKITQEGYVLKPTQPSFEAYGFSSRTSAGTLLFSDMRHNIGAHYNQSTGVFTAPVAGRYLILLFSGMKATNDYLGLGVLINGDTHYLGWTYNDIYHQPNSVMGVVELSKGDYVSPYANPDHSYTTPSTEHKYYSSFSMSLLG